MKVFKTQDIRNIALVGSAGAGKTIFAETMVFNGGLINRRGEVEKHTTLSDYKEVEHNQEHSVYASVLYTVWKDKKINIIDAPGSDDFIGGVVTALHVADSALVFLNAQSGVEIGAENAWEIAKKYNKPVVVIVNHLDHDNINYEKTIEEAREYLSTKVVQVQYPVNAGPDFDAVIDLLKMKMLKWNDDKGVAEELDIPDSEKDKAEELREALIEAAAESDESLMEIFFEEGTLTEEQLMQGLKTGFMNRELFPLFCSSAKKNYGVQRIMDFINNVLPSPDQMPPAKTVDGKEVPVKADAPTSLFVFKTTSEHHVGDILFFKVMSGKLTENMDLINQQKQTKERVAQIFVNLGGKRDKVSEMYAGDIGSTVKLRDTRTGHTLTEKGVDWKFPEIEYPEPKFWTAIKAESESEEEKLASILYKLHEEDPTFLVEYSKELRQMIVRGQGEHHINTVKWILDNIYKIGSNFIPARIAYRETVTKPAWAMYRHKKQTGGAGQFGEVHLVVEPYEEGKPDPKGFKFPDKEITLNIKDKQEFDLDWGGKFVFYNCIVGGAIDKNFMPAIIKGIFEKLENSPLTGSFVRDVRVFVFDGKMHPVDSNEVSFKLAGRNAFDLAFKAANPVILEPIYEVYVKTPADNVGDVMSDLNTRRAIIEDQKAEGRYVTIKAKVPLAEMNRYSTTLSSLTSGRGTYSMKFSHYAQVPPNVQDELVKKLAAENAEE